MSLEDQIVNILQNNPKTTRNELAEILGIPPDNVKYRLNKLRNGGKIKHQGSTKAGEWVVLKS